MLKRKSNRVPTYRKLGQSGQAMSGSHFEDYLQAATIVEK